MRQGAKPIISPESPAAYRAADGEVHTTGIFPCDGVIGYRGRAFLDAERPNILTCGLI